MPLVDTTDRCHEKRVSAEIEKSLQRLCRELLRDLRGVAVVVRA
jgi:hypothetical protein